MEPRLADLEFYITSTRVGTPGPQDDQCHVSVTVTDLEPGLGDDDQQSAAWLLRLDHGPALVDPSNAGTRWGLYLH